MNSSGEKRMEAARKASLGAAPCSRLLDYERLIEAGTISKAIYTLPGESVLIRNAFRWKRDGEVVSNAYESHSMEQVCEDRGWTIVTRYGDHIAIISENAELSCEAEPDQNQPKEKNE